MFTRNQILRAEGDGGGTGTTPAWYGAETNKAIVEANGFKSVDDVIKWGENAQKLIGHERAGRTVVLPKDDKDVDGIKAFRSKLGVPEDVKGYAVPESLKESLKDDPLVPLFMQAALEEGVPAKAFGGLLTKVMAAADKLRTDADGTAKTKSEAELAALKGEWGDKFNANAELARRYVKELGMDDADLGAIEGALGTTKFLKLFHAGGTKLGEASGAGGGAQGGGGNVTQEQAAAKINEARTQRIANQMTDAQYLEIANKYGPIAYPEPKVAA